jgi:hypothetical protein
MKIKSVNKAGVSATGTCYTGTISVTKNELELVLGNPVELYRDIDYSDGKTNFQWIVELSDGSIATVYDWKEDFIVDDVTEINWHIGGRKSNYEMFKNLLEDSITQALQKRKGVRR